MLGSDYSCSLYTSDWWHKLIQMRKGKRKQKDQEKKKKSETEAATKKGKKKKCGRLGEWARAFFVLLLIFLIVVIINQIILQIICDSRTNSLDMKNIQFPRSRSAAINPSPFCFAFRLSICTWVPFPKISTT